MKNDDLFKRLKDKTKDWLKEITHEDRKWAIDLAIKSGLPGTMKGDGPGDAFRHIIGSALLTKHHGYLGVLVGTIISEYDGYQDSLKKDGPKVARGRLWMDVRNNVWGVILWMRYGDLQKVGAATIRMIDRGPDENFASWQAGGFSEVGLSSQNSFAADEEPETGVLGPISDDKKTSGPRASWFSSSDNNDFHDKQEWKDIITDGIRGKVSSDEERDGKTTWPVGDDARAIPDEQVREIPTSAEELRELLIELGITSSDWSALDILFSPDIPDKLKMEELANQSPRNALLEAITVVICLPDTSDELQSSLYDWLRKNVKFDVDHALTKPEISDPPKNLKPGKIK